MVDIQVGTQIIRVQRTEFKGKEYIDIRKFYDADGEWKPTKKGISLSIDIVSKVKEAISQVELSK